MDMRLVFSVCFAGYIGTLSAATTIDHLRCEYATDPVGIDTLQPRLSWVLRSDERSQRQTAYQIAVAASRDDLDQARNLLWDTGRVASDQNVHVVYAGAPLASGSRCYWKVRVWTARGDSAAAPTPWSAPALWQVALLDASNWKAQWIGPRDSGTPAWGDFTLATDITLEKNAVGILFRMSDAENGYMWQINRALGADLLLRPHVCRSGTWSTLPAVSLRKWVPTSEDFKPHRVEIEARGDVIRTRIDGNLADERRDAAFACGTVGLRTSADERASVTAFSVTAADGRPFCPMKSKKAFRRFRKQRSETDGWT